MTGTHDIHTHSRPTTSETFRHWFDYLYYWIKACLPIPGVRSLVGLQSVLWEIVFHHLELLCC
jgi:hypothetical protein